ncbi:hypothetical protein HK097_004675 [Rhizophlyctis rosea]|uniref:DUF985 domain-containing protein n=1 Tax=Rhizophlyctis rosea TaxID=64517 RepID=A0AAD5S2U1_9FUNG|nr:hypothetical protein HK097_004675 [Rhizophlyctis rosea]
MRKSDIVKHFDLKPHPEGGFYTETYRDTLNIPAEALANTGHGGTRVASTAIMFLLDKGAVSRLHRLKSDEIFHLYPSTSSTTLLSFDLSTNTAQKITLGPKILAGETVQHLFKRNTWFGAYSNAESDEDYTLIGCTVAPGFDFQDFEMIDGEGAEELVGRFPEFEEEIGKLSA